MQISNSRFRWGASKTFHLERLGVDDKNYLLENARSLGSDAMALRAGASFKFDGAVSRLAIGVIEAEEEHGKLSGNLLWFLPKNGFLLPTKILAGAEIAVLQGDPDAVMVIADTGGSRRVPMESLSYLSIEEDCWLWISPVENEVIFLSSGIHMADGAEQSEVRRVQQAQVYETTGLPIVETIQRALAEQHRFECFPKTPSKTLFDPWRDSEYEDDDRYQVLQMRDMSAEFRGFMADWLAPLFGSARFYFQINMYERGDYVLPHRDSLKQGLMMLTEGVGNSLSVQSGDEILCIPDKAGRVVLCDTDAWHWVDPVQSAPRLTLVTIPAFITRSSLLYVSDYSNMYEATPR